MKILPAKNTDFEYCIKLLEENGLPVSDLREDKQKLWIAKENNLIVAVCGIEQFGNVAVFRSFAVDKAKQGTGIGKEIYTYVLSVVKKSGIEKFFLLTTTAHNYFKRLGWIEINRENIPNALKKSEEFKTICPQTAICMFLQISDGPVKNAIHYFKNDFNCAQPILGAFASQNGLDIKKALKLATGFGEE